ncbi:GNAT family N-acetyltransferase [Coralloluteibacterium thermophilus]|uniref:GNAT family N-acetyltransferase n=1 Tax=Coralloluteibacterium thermophilum TaxID=2707049 RepID=A0ABV9NKI0_9GAMM
MTGPAPAFRIETADYARDFEALRAVREPVFVVEQQVPIEEEWDALDPACFHVLARDAAGTPIGTGRLTPERKIGRMAVLAPWRGRGVATALLEALVAEARRRGWEAVSLHAQVQAMPFYARAGFEAYGEEFMEAGIAHRRMRRTLSGPEPLREHVAVRGAEHTAEVAERIVALARRELRLLSPDLDPAVFGRPALVEAMKRFAIAGRGGRILLLVHDATALSRQSHPLLGLLQRLPSVFEPRVVEEPVDREDSAAILVNDRGDSWFRAVAARQEGEALMGHPARARQLAQRFDALFERARPATELRALGI